MTDPNTTPVLLYPSIQLPDYQITRLPDLSDSPGSLPDAEEKLRRADEDLAV